MSLPHRQRSNFPRRVIALLRQRCPRCLEGHVYHDLVAMHETCPSCGYRFGREPGYFMGAMFASYALAVPLLFAIFMTLWYFFSTTWPLTFNLLVTFIVFLPFAPIIFRYSRVIWMHVDYQLDPDSPQRQG